MGLYVKVIVFNGKGFSKVITLDISPKFQIIFRLLFALTELRKMGKLYNTFCFNRNAFNLSSLNIPNHQKHQIDSFQFWWTSEHKAYWSYIKL